MASLFKPQIVRYLDKNGKRVKKNIPGARKVKEKAPKVVGEVPRPQRRRVARPPLC